MSGLCTGRSNFVMLDCDICLKWQLDTCNLCITISSRQLSWELNPLLFCQLRIDYKLLNQPKEMTRELCTWRLTTCSNSGCQIATIFPTPLRELLMLEEKSWNLEMASSRVFLGIALHLVCPCCHILFCQFPVDWKSGYMVFAKRKGNLVMPNWGPAKKF